MIDMQPAERDVGYLPGAVTPTTQVVDRPLPVDRAAKCHSALEFN